MTTDEDLIQQHRKEHPTAFVELYNRTWRYVRKKVGRQVYDDSRANDITEKVLVKVARKLDLFDHARGKFRSWVNKILSNTLIDEWKKRPPDVPLSQLGGDENNVGFEPTTDEDERPDTILENEEVCERLREEVEKLPDELRVIVKLRLDEGLTHQQISKRLDIPANTSGTRFNRAKDRLRQVLARFFPDLGSNS